MTLSVNYKNLRAPHQATGAYKPIFSDPFYYFEAKNYGN